MNVRRRLYVSRNVTMGSGYDMYTEEVLYQVTDESEANVIGSRTVLGRDIHMPVIDLDVPHHFVNSSTVGHSHLYIEVPMTWRKYKRLLKALYHAGVIDYEYYKLCVKRGQSFVRTPSTKK